MPLTLVAMPARRQAAVGLATSACALACFHVFWARPVRADTVARQHALAAARRELTTPDGRVDRLVRAEQRLAGLHARLEDLQAAVIRGDQAAGELRQVQMLAEASGLWITGFKPSPSMGSDGVSEATMVLGFEGRYAALLRFLQAVAELPRLVAISELRVRAVSDPSVEVTLAGTCRIAAALDAGTAAATQPPLAQNARPANAGGHQERGSR